MLFKDKNKYFLIFSITFITIYFFATTKVIEQGVYFKPEWVSILNSEQANLDELKSSYPDLTVKKHFPFILGNKFGYFSDEGKILNQQVSDNRVTISSSLWATNTEQNTKTEVYSIKNNLKSSFTINEAGFVHLDDDRIFLFEPDGCSVSQFDNTGNKLWRYAHCAPITAFQSSPNATIIGYSDGKLACVDSKGNTRFDFYPGGSNYQVIMGAGISEDGSRALCICGIQPQRMVLIEIANSHHKIVCHSSFKNHLRRQVFVNFNSTGKFAVFESAEGIGIIDCQSHRMNLIKEDGKIIDMGIKLKNNVLTILTEKDKENTLLAISPPDLIIGKTKFKAENSFLIQDEDCIYLGSNNKIMKIKLESLQK